MLLLTFIECLLGAKYVLIIGFLVIMSLNRCDPIIRWVLLPAIECTGGDPGYTAWRLDPNCPGSGWLGQVI